MTSSLAPVRGVLAGYLTAVAAGTVLLMIPASAAGGDGAGLRQAVFTSTSAVSGGGLTIVDTSSYWSHLGQGVLLVLMELGALGTMIGASLLGLVVARRLGIGTRLVAAVDVGPVHRERVRRLALNVVRISLVIQVVVWVALTLRLALGHDEPAGRAAWWGLFHTVSAFGNVGLTLWPDGVSRFAADAWVLVPLGIAVILGGIGYPALQEVLRVRAARQWSVHTRLTLITTAVLLVAGPLMISLLEWDNARTLGGLDPAARVLSGVFGGVTPRTAGLAGMDYGSVEPATRLVTEVLMLIGGGSAGTAGGIKVTTVAVLTLAVIAEVRGKHDTEAFGRRISPATLRQAVAVTMLAVGVVLAATLVVLIGSTTSLDTAVFETVSAFSLSGLSTGLPAQLPGSEQYLVAGLMLLGKAGPVCAASALALHQHPAIYRFPVSRPFIG